MGARSRIKTLATLACADGVVAKPNVTCERPPRPLPYTRRLRGIFLNVAFLNVAATPPHKEGTTAQSIVRSIVVYTPRGTDWVPPYPNFCHVLPKFYLAYS